MKMYCQYTSAIIELVKQRKTSYLEHIVKLYRDMSDLTSISLVCLLLVRSMRPEMVMHGLLLVWYGLVSFHSMD